MWSIFISADKMRNSSASQMWENDDSSCSSSITYWSCGMRFTVFPGNVEICLDRANKVLSCCRMWAAKMRGGSTRGESNNWVLWILGGSRLVLGASRLNGLVAWLVCNCVADPLVPQPEWELLHGEGSCTLPAAGQQQQQQQPQVTSSPQTCR